MRMFQSVSGHSSELSTANHSSRPTVWQLKCVSDTLSNECENPQPQKRQKSPPSLTLLSFKTRIKWPQGWPQTQVFRGYFFNFGNFQCNVQAFRLTRLLTAFSLRFADLTIKHRTKVKTITVKNSKIQSENFQKRRLFNVHSTSFSSQNEQEKVIWI